jgi:hypothetical protein
LAHLGRTAAQPKAASDAARPAGEPKPKLLFLPLVLFGDVRQTNVFIAGALSDEPIVERDVGVSAALFVNLKS